MNIIINKLYILFILDLDLDFNRSSITYQKMTRSKKNNTNKKRFNNNNKNGKVTTPSKNNKKKNDKPMNNKATKKTNSTKISASELEWKAVDIPDNLDDFGGFYGLEEIDGVDVKVGKDGKVEFFKVDGGEDVTGDMVGSNGDIFEEEKDKEEEQKEEEEDDEEFKDSKEEQSFSKDIENNKESESENESNYESANELEPFSFSKVTDDVIDSSIIPINLPNWEKIEPKLSFKTLQTLSRLNFTKPTEIQKRSIPIGLNGHDILGKASTGSGKTLAYGIPIIEKILSQENDSKKTVGIVFTPTRELAQQVSKHLEEFTWGMNKNSVICLTGGMSLQKQERLLSYEDGAGKIVVSTPGRFLEILEIKKECIKRFSEIDILVLDEADRLLQDGHFEEFERILKLLGSSRRELSKSRNNFWQTMVFSATFSLNLFDKLDKNHNYKKRKNNDEDEMDEIVKKLMEKIHFKSKPIIIDTNPIESINNKIYETLIECEPLERDLYVYYFLIMYGGSTIIFCNSINSVKRLSQFLRLLNIHAIGIHSGMIQKQRMRSMERFIKNSKANQDCVLIATDVAARGIDIPSIDHVIHYHTPRSSDVYIHRSGRAARGINGEGVSVVISSAEESASSLRNLIKKIGKKKMLPLLNIEMDIVGQIRERCRVAREISNDESKKNVDKKDEDWSKQAAKDLGLDDSDEEDEEIDDRKIEIRNKRNYLKTLLKEKIRKDRRRKYITGGLSNLADQVVHNKGHDKIVGHANMDALEQLRNKKRKKSVE